jgi:phage protein D
MEIRELERQHNNFYTPTFVVTVGRRDVVRDLYLTVTSVSVDIKEKAAGRFTFTVANSYDWETREFVYLQGQERANLLDEFAFGAEVEIAIGYADPGELRKTPMITGLITELSTGFAAGGSPELTISGYDELYWMTVGKHRRTWDNKTDSFIVEELARANDQAHDVQPTSPPKVKTDQNEENDLSFITKLSERNNNFTFYIGPEPESPFGEQKFRFKQRSEKAEPVVELAWGKGLVGFTPEAKLGGQIAEVHIDSVDPRTGKPIRGRATRADLAAADGQTATEAVAAARSGVDDGPIFRARTPVYTQEEADARALGILADRAQEFITGSGESIGLPEIRPDNTIDLDGLGRGFSKTYWVSGAVHTIDSGGYKTTFEVRERSIDDHGRN